MFLSFAQQASMPETHDDETLLQIDDDCYGRKLTSDGSSYDNCKIKKANRANGSKEKRIVPIEDSNSKALVAKDSQGEIDWTKEFDDEPVTFAMMALNGIEEDDWSLEIEQTMWIWTRWTWINLIKKLLNDYQTEKDNFQRARLEIQGYQLSLESLEDLELNIVSSEEKVNNSSGDENFDWSLYEKFQREKALQTVPPPTGLVENLNHETCESKKNRDDLIKNKEQTQNTVKSNTDRNKVIIEDWVDSDDEEVPLGVSEIKKQTVLKSETSSENKSPRSKDSFGQRSRGRGLGYRDGKGNPEEELKDHAIIDSGCSGIAKHLKDEAICGKKMGHVNFKNLNKLVKAIGQRHPERVQYCKDSTANGVVRESMGLSLKQLEPCLKFPTSTNSISGLKQYILLVMFSNRIFLRSDESEGEVDFDDVDDQQLIVHGSSSIGNKAVSEDITNAAQHKDSAESTIVKEVPLTIEDQDLQKEFENSDASRIHAHYHMKNSRNSI
ncbi:hypothetical protein Tco_0838613 [Tanacetum coccineum]|uniref:Uncharacterized protein n=1 Tax=Tanacetum coccineum TaxID=301880 RepID=A0ABQ5APB9_9ASTR